ncbi:MAG: hypothetical protein Q4C65_01900 [Eubacteriales bacterium]|nr:hypothetical protein [Eubacteriales bacterium]
MTDIEKKLELTRFLREENHLNRMKLRSREEILYGPEKAGPPRTELPPFYEGHPGGEAFGIPADEREHAPALGLRLALALILFGAVIYMDKNAVAWGNRPAVQVISEQLAAPAGESLLRLTGTADGE